MKTIKDKKPTKVEIELILAASAAVECADDLPLVQITTSGSNEQTTLVVVAFLIPNTAHDPAIEVIGNALEFIQPAIEVLERRRPDSLN